MAELWPELAAVPMGDGLATNAAELARRRRTLEVMLDRVSLLTTDTSEHLLDPTFEGAFTAADLQLREEIDRLMTELALTGVPGARAPAAFGEVRAMLLQLGLPAEQLPGSGAAAGAVDS